MRSVGGLAFDTIDLQIDVDCHDASEVNWDA